MLIYGLVILIIQDVYCVPGQMSLLQQGGQSCLLLRRGRSTNPKYICLHSTGANDLEQIILVCIVLYCIVLYCIVLYVVQCTFNDNIYNGNMSPQTVLERLGEKKEVDLS